MPKPLPTTIDYYSKRGAETLAAMVTTYWVKRGVGHVVAEAFAVPGHAGLWGVRSNLVGGRPPARVEKHGRHSNGKVKLTPRVEPEVLEARKRFLA